MYRHKKFSVFILIPLLASMLFLIGCEEEEDNLIAEAQECFNKIGNADDATPCLTPIQNLTSTKAYRLQCGIYSHIGGLNTQAFTDAFDAYENAAPGQEEATLITSLSMDTSAEATTAYNACKASGYPGLIYLASLSKIGTLAKEAAGGSGTPGAMITACIGDPSCDNAETGELLVTAAELYCSSDSDNDVCQSIQASIDTYGSDYAAIANDFLSSIDY